MFKQEARTVMYCDCCGKNEFEVRMENFLVTYGDVSRSMHMCRDCMLSCAMKELEVILEQQLREIDNV